jgi:hypothetical protein
VFFSLKDMGPGIDKIKGICGAVLVNSSLDELI